MRIRTVVVQGSRALILMVALGAGSCRGCCDGSGASSSGSALSCSSGCTPEPSRSCGYADQLCCPTTVDEPCHGGRCVDGQCRSACGEDGEWCCVDGGSECASDLTCVIGTCRRCGHPAQPCCESGNPCPLSNACISGTCRACGGSQEPCCDGGCYSGLSCRDGVCPACGAPDMACCPDGECEADSLFVTTADGGRCRRCGSVERPCCEGGVCARAPLPVRRALPGGLLWAHLQPVLRRQRLRARQRVRQSGDSVTPRWRRCGRGRRGRRCGGERRRRGGRDGRNRRERCQCERRRCPQRVPAMRDAGPALLRAAPLRGRLPRMRPRRPGGGADVPPVRLRGRAVLPGSTRVP